MKILVQVQNIEDFSKNTDIVMRINLNTFEQFVDRMCNDKETLKDILAHIFKCDVTKVKQIKRSRCQKDVSSIMVNVKNVRYHITFLNYKELETIEFTIK